MTDYLTHGGYFSPLGLMKINEGGSHEENPNGGVQVGVDQQGIPNLVEEDEVIYDDFVYSDNIKADGGILEQFNIPSKYTGKLYSDIASAFADDADEQIDPITINGLRAMLGRLAQAQEEQKRVEEEKALMEELKNMSPEELEELEAALAQEQEQQVPVEEVVPEEIPVEQTEVPQMMAMGGPVNILGDGTPGSTSGGGGRVGNQGQKAVNLLRDVSEFLNPVDKKQITMPDGKVVSVEYSSVPLVGPRAARVMRGIKFARTAIPTGLLVGAADLAGKAIGKIQEGNRNHSGVMSEEEAPEFDFAYGGHLFPDGGRKPSFLSRILGNVLDTNTPAVSDLPGFGAFGLKYGPFYLLRNTKQQDPSRYVAGAGNLAPELPPYVEEEEKSETPAATAKPSTTTKQGTTPKKGAATKAPEPTLDEVVAQSRANQIEKVSNPLTALQRLNELKSLNAVANKIGATAVPEEESSILAEARERLRAPKVDIAGRDSVLNGEYPSSTDGFDYRLLDPIIAAGQGLATAFMKPDHYEYTPIRPYVPSGSMRQQYERYNPIDINLVINRMRAQTQANTRALRNAGIGPSLGASLLANDYNAQLNEGNALTNVWDANNQRRNQVIQQNNQADATLGNFYWNVEQAGANALNQFAPYNQQNALRIAMLNNQAEQDKYNALSSYINGTRQFFSNYGTEMMNRQMVNSNPALLGYGIDRRNRVVYDRDGNPLLLAACGGKLKK